MAVTITYKGHTLADFEGTGKRLKTAGKYMEDHLSIVDDSIDGDPLGYGNNTASMVGVGQVEYLILSEDTTIGTAKIGDRLT